MLNKAMMSAKTSAPRTWLGRIASAGILFALVFTAWSGSISASPPLDGIRHLLQENDAVIVSSPQGKILFEANSDARLIPASILKIFTALAALHYLGPDYRFPTEFYLGPGNSLKIKGYGDPLLISETMAEIARDLGKRLKSFEDMELDDSYFKNSIRVPGVSSTFQPYDSPNGALCVNFNTVNFRRAGDGAYVSAEKQTPLLPVVTKRIETSSLENGRIVLTDRNGENTLYAGHLFKYFLEQEGIESGGEIRIGRVAEPGDRLLLTYLSPFSLKQVINSLLEFSNNFIANQILLAAGAKIYGPPGTLDKGVKAAVTYARRQLKIKDFTFVEGSGISRENRISAKTMLKVLDEFEPHHAQLRQGNSEFYKTGHLDGVETRAGYLSGGSGALYRFVVMINTPGTSIQSVMREIRRHVASLDPEMGRK